MPGPISGTQQIGFDKGGTVTPPSQSDPLPVAPLGDGYGHISGPVKLTVDGSSKTLEQLGLTLNSATKGLRFIVPTAGIFFNYGAATADSAPLLVGAWAEDEAAAVLETLQFITAGGSVAMFVEEVGT